MKLTKIISLMLVFAMIVTAFSAITVSAEGTADLKFVIFNEAGNAEVTENLEVGKIYQVAFTLSNISAGRAKSAQITAMYNTAVVELVDESGIAGTDYDVVIERSDFYDKKSKTGYYENVALDTASKNGLIDYALGVAKELSEDIRNNGVEMAGDFEIVRFRFKAKANGKLGFALATEAMGAGNYNDTNPTGIIFANTGEVEVTEIPCTARVGKIAYVSATTPVAFNPSVTKVVGKTTAEEIIAELPATVNVTYVDEEGGNVTKEAAITWEKASNFDANEVGEYEFAGTVTTPDGINYTGAAVKVAAAVKIDTLKVQSVDAIDDIKVRVGDTVTLPEKVTVEVTGGDKKELAVIWDPATVDTTAAGVYSFLGALVPTAEIDFDDDKKAAVKVVVYAASADKAPTVVAPVEGVEAVIDAADIAVDAVAALPEFVLVGESANEFIDVEWVQTEESKKEAYEIGDVLVFVPVAKSGDVTFPDTYKVEVKVAVPEGKKTVTFEKTTYTTADIRADEGYTLEKAIAAAAFAGKYADGTAADLSKIVWDKDAVGFDATVAKNYTLVGTWADIYGNTQKFTITIKIVNAGATEIKIYSSAYTTNELKELILYEGYNKTVFARLEPAAAVDTVEWSAKPSSLVKLEPSRDTLSVKITAKYVGTLKITARTTSGKEAEFNVVIRSDNSGGGGNPLVGMVLAEQSDKIEQQKIAEASVFNDLGGYEWAATQIETLRLLSVVSGKSNTAYAPADSVTRAEFLAMLVRLFGFQANGEAKTFTDVPADAWFYDTVSIASSIGIAYGYENGAFDPNAVISRQDMAVFAERAIVASGLTPVRGIERAFNDAGEIAEYAKVPVSNMSSYGVINGMNDGTFAPAATANRAQAAVVVYNLYVLKNK